jgi:hypothetical protein
VTTTLAVRDRLVGILRHDLVGPDPGPQVSETLPQAPSRWYLMGCLVPYEPPEEHQTDPAGPTWSLARSASGDGREVPGSRAILHARCMLVDDERAVATSAGFATAAQQHHLEAGMLLADVAFVRALRGQFDALVAAGVLRTVPGMGA